MNYYVTLERIKNIITDIKSDDEWVNDSHTHSEYKGVCDGLDILVKHLEETDERQMNEKEFIKWLDKNAPVDYEEVQHFSDEAGASIWIRFDLDKEED